MHEEYEQQNFWNTVDATKNKYFITDFSIVVKIELPEGLYCPPTKEQKTYYSAAKSEESAIPWYMFIGLIN